MIKRHVFSAVFLTASLFALSSCQFFFESVRDFTAEEVPENKSKKTPVPLPPATPTKTGCNFSNFQLFKQLDDNNYTTQETVKYFIPDEDFSEDNIFNGFLLNTTTSYKFQYSIDNISDDVELKAYFSKDGSTVSSKELSLEENYIDYVQEGNNISLTTKNEYLSKLNTNPYQQNRLYFYLYDKDGNLYDVQFIIIFLTQDDYYPAIKFHKQNITNIHVDIDTNDIYDSYSYNSNGYDLEYTFTCNAQLPENFICSIGIPLLNSSQEDIKIFSSFDSEKMAENYTNIDLTSATSASISYSLFTPHLITEYITHIYLAENISDKIMFITDDYQFRISRI